MKNLQTLFENICNRKIAISGSKIKQNVRNDLKREIMQELENSLKSNLENELIQVAITSNGVGVALDNENIGFICFEIDLKIKDLDYDLQYENESYIESIEQKELEKAEKEKAKQEKIKADIEARKRKAEEKAKKLAEQMEKAEK